MGEHIKILKTKRDTKVTITHIAKKITSYKLAKANKKKIDKKTKKVGRWVMSQLSKGLTPLEERTMGRSLLTSLFTFCFISIRIYVEKTLC